MACEGWIRWGKALLAWQHQVWVHCAEHTLNAGAEVAGEPNNVDKEANSQKLVFADSLYITVHLIDI